MYNSSQGQAICVFWAHNRAFPQCNLSLGSPEILSQNHTHMLSMTERVQDFQNNALWDTHECALLCIVVISLHVTTLQGERQSRFTLECSHIAIPVI